mgnify:CR=1 FL=1
MGCLDKEQDGGLEKGMGDGHKQLEFPEGARVQGLNLIGDTVLNLPKPVI